jgi:hypothetical protein
MALILTSEKKLDRKIRLFEKKALFRHAEKLVKGVLGRPAGST